ncbi:5'-3' exonuclease [Paenibacillus turpanensis]|uniref:5'-3' exonuclease n=1 Tax=Paenibacillus turpanensis TaxID=2689078 RepID=UPI00140A0B5F|nr:5'-3' exonuclease H3TH domain-containing protein [Paenibacillus turpanensis]
MEAAMNSDTPQSEKHLMLIDSFALLFRGYFATAVTGNLMQTSTGLYTNGLYQFTRYMMDAIKRFKPTHVVCAFDMGKTTFRTEKYPEYKAQRQSPPEPLIPQFDKLWELVEAFDIPAFGISGYEADDLIGSIAKQASGEGVKVSILTGDGDSVQLIDENTQVLMLKKGFGNYEAITLDNLYELKGVKYPHQIIELKGLMGDASDNIPGCPNVGPKTALKLLEQFETIDGIYARIDEVAGKLKQRLIDNKDLIYMSKELATIQTDIETLFVLEQSEWGWNKEKLQAKFEEFEFKSLIRTIA